MFGYITPVLSALPDERKKRYRALYCGVCHSLLARHGQAAQVTLSNDLTFLALLLNSLYEPECRMLPARCAVHPLHARDYLQSSLIDYAADMNVLLAYYKAVDQELDEKSPAAGAARRKLRKPFERVAEAYPRQAEEVRSALEENWRLEKTEAPEVDLLCNLSGRMLGAVFVPRPEDLWASALRSVGEGLGRFVYWMDAYDDYDADRKKGRFNPLTPYRNREDYHSFSHDTLELFIAEAAEAFEILPLEQDLDLLRNILYSGVWQRYNQLEEKRLKQHQKEEDRHAES